MNEIENHSNSETTIISCRFVKINRIASNSASKYNRSDLDMLLSQWQYTFATNDPATV